MLDLDLRVRLLRALVVAAEEAVDRRDLEAADGADHTRAVRDVLRLQPGEVADEIAGFLLLEEQAAHVLRLALEIGSREVDDRELRAREAPGHGRRGVAHEEADRDHEVVALAGRRRQVRHVVRVRLGDEHASLDAVLLLGVLKTLVRQEVERAVVEPADVGHERDLVGRRSLLDVGLRGTRSGAERQRQDRDQSRRDERRKPTYVHIPSLEVTSTAKLGRLITP